MVSAIFFILFYSEIISDWGGFNSNFILDNRVDWKNTMMAKTKMTTERI